MKYLLSIIIFLISCGNNTPIEYVEYWQQTKTGLPPEVLQCIEDVRADGFKEVATVYNDCRVNCTLKFEDTTILLTRYVSVWENEKLYWFVREDNISMYNKNRMNIKIDTICNK